MNKPAHYDKETDPWDLTRSMSSSGNVFVDARRADVLKYVFRKKESLLQDLRKAKHCLEAAIEELETKHHLNHEGK